MSNGELSAERIQELVAEWVRETLKEEEQARTRPAKPVVTENDLYDRYEAFDWVQTLNKEDLGLSRHVESMGHQVDWILKDHGITIDKVFKTCKHLETKQKEMNLKNLKKPMTALARPNWNVMFHINAVGYPGAVFR